MLSFLEPVAPATDRPNRPPDSYLPMQEVTRQIAFEPSGWDEERKAKVAALFDGLAPEWHSRGGPERLKPTEDALRRGEVPTGGRAVEIGSGTGIHSGLLAGHFDSVVAVDLSAAMLSLAPRRGGVSLLRGDAATLPLRDSSVSAVVCVNAYLFPAEYARVLSPGGRIVFVSTSGEQTPIFLRAEEVLAALSRVAKPAKATSSQCGWGHWTVVALES